MLRTRVATAWLLSVVTVASERPANAAKVKGIVDAPSEENVSGVVGMMRTRIAAPSVLAQSRRTDLALFLSVKESLPLPPTKATTVIKVSGLRLMPSVVSCAIDGFVLISNEEPHPVTIHVGEAEFTSLAPGKSKRYECTAGAVDSNLRPVLVAEWPHMRGAIYVGEIGVVGVPDAEGGFELAAPKGTYELHVVGRDGIVARRRVSVDAADVDLGHIRAVPARRTEPGTSG